MDVVQRAVCRLQAQRVSQRVARRRGAGRVDSAGQVLNGLLEEVAEQGYCHGMRILVICDTGCTVGQRTVEFDAVGIAAVAVEPLGGADDVGQGGTVLAVGIQLRTVIDDQALVRPDYRGRREHGQGKLTVRATAVSDGVVGTCRQWPLAGNRRYAVRCKYLRIEDLRRLVAHTPRGTVRKAINDGDVPGVAQARVVDIDAEFPPLAKVQRAPQRGRAGLGYDQLRCRNRQRFRDSPFTRKRLVEHAVD